MNYTLSRPSFNMFADVLGKERAEAFVSEFEQVVAAQRAEYAQQRLLDQTQIKTVVKEELRNELITRELFDERFKVIDERFKLIDQRFKSLETTIDERFKVVDERFKVVDERFKRVDFKLNVLIALAFVALTFANPTFVELVKHAIK